MSIQGTIFKAETSRTFEEMIDHLALFATKRPEGNKFEVLQKDEGESKELASKLKAKVELVKEYFMMRGSFTLDATRTLINLNRAEKETWKSTMLIQTFTSPHIAEHAKKFWSSNRQKEGWIISQWMDRTQELRPHQMPIFVEKKDGKFYCIIFDTRLNWEGIRKDLIEAFSPFGVKIMFYLSTERRQFDWSTCSHLSLSDLRKLDRMDRDKLYTFIEDTRSSVEYEKDHKWTLFVSPHLPPSFMELAQSSQDLSNYFTWANKSAYVSKGELSALNARTKHYTDALSSLNQRIVHLYHMNVNKMIARILLDRKPDMVYVDPVVPKEVPHRSNEFFLIVTGIAVAALTLFSKVVKK